MNIESYAIDSNDENLIAKLNNNDVSSPQFADNHDYTDKEQWKKSLDLNSYETSRSSTLNSSSSYQNTLEGLKFQNVTNNLLQEGNSLSKSDYYPREEPPRKGRASLIRLQAAVDYAGSSTHADSDFSLSETTSGDSGNQSNLSTGNSTLPGSFSNNLFGPDNSVSDVRYASTTNEIHESSEFPSALDFDEIQNNPDIQKFLTTDGQYVYGYKNSGGEFQFFYPSLNDRERHNEKERRRRSRVSGVCKSLRQIVPGLNEKIDKASVFEYTARYLQFLRDKYGTQFDQEYCEKHCLFERKGNVPSSDMYM